jgi:hypothetical protein
MSRRAQTVLARGFEWVLGTPKQGNVFVTIHDRNKERNYTIGYVTQLDTNQTKGGLAIVSRDELDARTYEP